MRAISISKPAGAPSVTATSAGPCHSPAVRKRNIALNPILRDLFVNALSRRRYPPMPSAADGLASLADPRPLPGQREVYWRSASRSDLQRKLVLTYQRC